jgi:restriction endonuclease Mrr
VTTDLDVGDALLGDEALDEADADVEPLGDLALVEERVGVEEGELSQDQLLARLGNMSPSAFERLAQRLLREAGFRDVAVVGKSGDGGIDRVGVLRVSLVSFPVYFQCKRYRELGRRRCRS